MNQTLDQQRAASAWAATPDQPSKEYRSLVASAPASIYTNGLGQVVAFYLAKGTDSHKVLLNTLAAWVLRSDGQPDSSKTGRNLLDAITAGTSDHYRALTTESLAYLDWLKRFAEAKANQA